MSDQSPPPIHEQAAWLAGERDRLMAELARLDDEGRALVALMRAAEARDCSVNIFTNWKEQIPTRTVAVMSRIRGRNIVRRGPTLHDAVLAALADLGVSVE